MKGFTHERVNSNAEWYTPKWVFDSLGAVFDLDPCSPGEGKSHVPASRHLTKQDDGLTTEWQGHVFCNPPYGRGIENWMRKCANHGDAIALVPARTDTKWFYEAAKSADAVLFVKQRIKFHPGDKDAPNDGSPGAGNVLFAWGERSVRELQNCSIPGIFYYNKEEKYEEVSGS